MVHSHEYGKFLTGQNHTPVFYTLNTGVWFVSAKRFAVFMRENFKKINKKNTEGDDTQRYKKKRERDEKREIAGQPLVVRTRP